MVPLRFCIWLALGVVGGPLGVRPIFLGTGLLLAISAGFNQLCRNATARSEGMIKTTVMRDGWTNDAKAAYARVGKEVCGRCAAT
ncbi:hypothetical protein [Sodalis sp.]|uniref:hypothetical protein n=1 Tax=Sodalis sp. (in: enterobacteria) TaxID=1898979 RepID=UPI0038730E69